MTGRQNVRRFAAGRFMLQQEWGKDFRDANLFLASDPPPPRPNAGSLPQQSPGPVPKAHGTGGLLGPRLPRGPALEARPPHVDTDVCVGGRPRRFVTGAPVAVDACGRRAGGRPPFINIDTTRGGGGAGRIQSCPPPPPPPFPKAPPAPHRFSRGFTGGLLAVTGGLWGFHWGFTGRYWGLLRVAWGVLGIDWGFTGGYWRFTGDLAGWLRGVYCRLLRVYGGLIGGLPGVIGGYRGVTGGWCGDRRAPRRGSTARAQRSLHTIAVQDRMAQRSDVLKLLQGRVSALKKENSALTQQLAETQDKLAVYQRQESVMQQVAPSPGARPPTLESPPPPSPRGTAMRR